MQTELTRALGIDVPVICGAMYPCSNPELVAAVSEAGAIGVVQPLSLSYVHGYEFRKGLRYIRSLTSKPIGVNLIIEKSSGKYMQRVHQWVDIALEEQVPFFVTALGNPRWVVEQAQSCGVTIYHDVTNKKWADKAVGAGVDGLICVNNRAGGHTGSQPPQSLLEELSSLGKPLICAGGIGKAQDHHNALAMGYAGTQSGTRFIATRECNAHKDYKQAILQATESDIVLTEKISGVPVSIIKTAYIERIGTRASALARWMLRGRKTKHWMRTFYTLQSLWKLKHASVQGAHYQDYFQAGKSVAGIHRIQSVAEVVADYALASQFDRDQI